MARKKKDLTREERLKLLEERYEKKEISEETYESMKKELMENGSEWEVTEALTNKKASKLTNEERLKLLEERHKKGEISDETYNELTAELKTEEPGKVVTAPVMVPMQPPAPKAKKLPVLPVAIVVIIIIILITGLAFAGGLFGAGGKSGDKGSGDSSSPEVRTWTDEETIDGSITAGGPLTIVPDEQVNFEVAETVVKMEITLTWNPQSMDLDLEIHDPDGNVAGTSGNPPGEPESVTISRSIDAGTWTAMIDPFAAVNAQYTLQIIYYHEEVISEGGGEGALFYQKVESLVDKDGEESDQFDVGEQYESLYLQVVVEASTGSMSIEIMDPSGDVAYSNEVTGPAQEVDEKTISAVEGEWEVVYNYDHFTGDLVIQIVGIE